MSSRILILSGWVWSVVLCGASAWAAAVWNPEPAGNALQGDTIVTLDGETTLNDALTGDYKLNVAGNGTLIVNAYQGYTGGTVIENGASVRVDCGASGKTVGVLRNFITVKTGGKFIANSGSIMNYDTGTPVLNMYGGAVEVTEPSAVFIIKTLTSEGGGTLTDTHAKTGWGGNFALDGDWTVGSGDLVMTAGRIVLSSRYASTWYTNKFDIAAGASLTMNGALQNVETNTSSVSTDDRSLTKTGAGTMTINGLAAYRGTTNVTGGILKLGVDNAISSSSLNLNGGTLDLNGHNLTVTRITNLNSVVTNSSAASDSLLTLNIAAGSTKQLSGTFTDDATRKLALELTGGGTLEVAAKQTFDGGFKITNGTVKITADRGGAQGSVQDGVLRGTITIEKDGTLAFTKGSAMGYGRNGDFGSPELVLNGGTVDNSDSISHNLLHRVTFKENALIRDTVTGRTGWAGNMGLDGDITVLSGTGNRMEMEKIVFSARYSATPGTIAFDVQNDSALTLAGNLLTSSTTLAGARSLTKTGTGTLILAGAANTYTGATTVQAGTVKIDTTGLNSVSFPSTFQVQADGKLEILLDPASLSTLSMTKISATNFEDIVLSLVGTPDANADIRLNFTDGVYINNTKLTSPADFAKLLSPETAYYFDLSANGNNFELRANPGAVPEPATWALLLAGLCALAFRGYRGR